MISNDELQHKLQIVSYEIIAESITEEERSMMNLQAEEIIPTISFFKKMQSALFDRYYNGKFYPGKNIEYEFCYEKWDFETQTFYHAPEIIQVNLAFLKLLCKENNIIFYTFEDRYHFEISSNNLYNDIKRKCLI